MNINDINKVIAAAEPVDERQMKLDHVRYAVSASNKGVKRVRDEADASAKISAALSGVPKSDEHREKLRHASLEAPKYECSQCHGMFYAGALKRWHNGNCKPKPPRKYKQRAPWARVACNACGELVPINVVNQYHNDNCKKRPRDGGEL